MPKPKPAGRLCPICRQPVAEATRPFCSPRCRDIDLNRWLSGGYAIPAEDPMEEEELEALMDEAAQDQPNKD